MEKCPQSPAKPDPFAFADFTWLSGNPRTREAPLDTKAFTGEFRAERYVSGNEDNAWKRDETQNL